MSALRKPITMISHEVGIEIASNPYVNASVFACAGSGKTTLLCQRFYNLVQAGAEADKILCLTYTKSAAEEMLGRILEKFEMSDSLLKLKHRLKIQTIHSFCLEILCRYAQNTGSKNLEVIDHSVYNKYLNDEIHNIIHDIKFYDVINELSDFFEIPRIKNMIFSIITSINNMYLESISYTQEHIEIEGKPLSQDDIFIYHLNEIDQKYGKNLNIFSRYYQNKDYDNLKNIALNQNGQMRKILTKKFSNEHKELSCDIENIQHMICAYEKQKLADIYKKHNDCFIILIKEIIRRYKCFKKANHYIDYDDIIHDTISLLKLNQNILYNLDYEIRHILVDEAQDLSANQWSLISQLTEESFAGEGIEHDNLKKTIFLVGDIKQSIFGFQGAKPELLNYYKALFQSKSIIPWHDVELNVSYRSDEKIIEFVNDVFMDKMPSFPLHIANSKAPGLVKIWPLPIFHQHLKADVEHSKTWKMPQKDCDIADIHDMAAANIAAIVDTWLAGGKMIESKKILPSDIMILIRKRSRYLDALVRNIKAKGIKVSSPAQKSFATSLVVSDILSLIKFFLHKDDELNLVGLLKSPWFDVSEEELKFVALKRTETLYKHLENLNHPLHQKLQYFESFYLLNQSIYLFLYNLLFANEHINKFLEVFGSNCMEYIDKLLEEIHKIESKFFTHNPKDILDNLKNIVYNSISEEDALSIMTIHSAKGLQAKIVILADATAKTSSISLEAAYYFDGKFYINSANGYGIDDYCHMLNQKNQLAEEEEMRLLYVALTRAKHELHVFGISDKKKCNWYNILSESEMSEFF